MNIDIRLKKKLLFHIDIYIEKYYRNMLFQCVQTTSRLQHSEKDCRKCRNGMEWTINRHAPSA